MDYRFARRMAEVRASEIRELLKLTQNPRVISFAGGLPAPEFFPVEEMKAIAVEVLERHGREALQYSTTEGHPPLRQAIADRLNGTADTHLSGQEVIITTGSQQGLDLCAKLFLDEGDAVLCESPTYIGAISAFRVFRPRWVEVPTDDEGMIADALEERLAHTGRVKLVYVVPDFQNPSGRTWSLERRRGLLAAAARHGVPVVEDSPYRELRFEGESVPSLKALDPDGLVISLGTFSKIFCPGLRLGWLAAARPVLEKCVILKQGADLHTATLAQMEAAAYMGRIDLDAAIGRIRGAYRSRRDAMVAALAEHMPPGCRFTRPSGGLFLWGELPPRVNARDLLEKCLARDVAFVPGGAFFPNGGHGNTLRLNFSNMPEERIAEGVRRLAMAIREIMDGEGAAAEREAQPAFAGSGSAFDREEIPCR